MASQPSFKPLTKSDFFGDGRSARPIPEGTVARGYLRTDTALFTGRKTPPPGESEANNEANANSAGANRKSADNANAENADADKTDADQAVADKNAGQQPASKRGFENNADFVDEFPIPIDETTIEHGYHRFMIYCVVCHDPLGTGRGKIVERGFTPPPSYHIDRLRQAPVGRLFAVVSEGYGSMPSYGEQIPPRDRWAIIAYVRALQLSQHFPEDQLTGEMRQKLQAAESESSAGATDLSVLSGPPAKLTSREASPRVSIPRQKSAEASIARKIQPTASARGQVPGTPSRVERETREPETALETEQPQKGGAP